MILVTLIYLHFLFAINYSGLADLNHPECRNVNKNDIVNMCKNPKCVKNVSVAMFCEHVYEKMFKCQNNYFPLRFVCDGIDHCQSKIDEDPAVCSYVACENNRYKCTKENKCIDFSKLCNGINDCQDGLDESSLVCKALIVGKKITCPSVIFDETHVVACSIRYGNHSSVISCYESLPPDTEAEVRCNAFFKSEDLPNFQVLKCQGDGTWDKDIMKCKPDCGTINDDITMTPLILNGVSINSALWPWYAALFTLKNDRWTFFCSSTLVSRNTLITAAHCVWTMTAEDIKVAAGKTFSDFYIQEPASQINDIHSIFMHPLYLDSLGNYGSDIALLRVKDTFSLKSVLPICMNRSLRNIVGGMMDNDRIEGKVVGMGLTENGKISTQLRSTDVQIISNKACQQNQRYEFRKYVTIATFCAKGVTDGVVCNGDSGSGLAVKNAISGKWTLEGLVSISPKHPNDVLCDKNSFSIYTNVGMYSNWIFEYISE